VVLTLGFVVSSGHGAPERGGNYLIIVPPAYNDTAPLTQFVNAKSAQGYTVSVYQVTSGTTNTAIRNYVVSLWNTLQEPKFILIVGDTAGSSSTSNTIPHFIGTGSRGATTDWPYGCMPDRLSWYPSIPVGRFAVASVAQLQNVVDKTLFVEAGNFSDPEYVTRGAFLANNSTQGMADPTHDWVINTYLTPRGYTGIRIYESQGGNTAHVTAAVNNGCLWTVYYGHSGSSGWWAPAFDQNNVNALSNAGLYGLVCGWSCNTAHFSYDECFGETWIRAANKGAAAYLSASDYIYWGSAEEWMPSTVLEKAFFASFFEKDIWQVGPAWVTALYRFLREHGQWDGNYLHVPAQNLDHCHDFLEEFVLLGDPSLCLPQPNGFTLASNPTTQALCCPPAQAAEYTINVGKLGSFSEAVTLGASSLPAGATSGFTVNGLAPPFTSVLTVGNLGAVAAGEYSIVVTGTSASMQRSTNVVLRVAHGIPDPVAPSSPPHGASGVALKPELVWTASSGASGYDVQVAADPGFATVVYTASVTGTSHTLTTALNPATPYYWRVRAVNACGQGSYGSAFLFSTVSVLQATSYDLLNGETGTYSYFDDLYNGSGNNTVPLAPLSGGLGDLTDGVVATQHWNSTNLPYVGWKSIQPTITFHFAGNVNLHAVTIHVDDSGGGGGVVPPSHVTLNMGGVNVQFPVTDPPDNAPFAATFSNLGMTGDTLALTLQDAQFTTSRYMMLSEVTFEGDLITGACCVGEACSVLTEGQCAGLGGVYHGAGTGCNPDPCLEYDSVCLLISEVVHGAESGSCPRWIEITNTGLQPFAFFEGGVIVQMDGSADVDVDIDLSGVVIGPGEKLVINSTQNGECANAYQFIYGTQPGFETAVPLGDGDDRYLLTDTADGSHLVDIYGVFGTDGTGEDWECTEGYSYRLPGVNTGNDGAFDAAGWMFGGVGSLGASQGDPTELLLTRTTPGAHVYERACIPYGPADFDGDADVDWSDYESWAACLAGPGQFAPPPGCSTDDFAVADLDGDGDVDLGDFLLFAVLFTGE